MISKWLQLVRFPNLVIVGLTQYLLQYKLLLPSFTANNIISELSHFHFGLLCLMTILATAAGYVINDFYDYDIDIINKPQKVIVGKLISPRRAKIFYLVLVLFGGMVAGHLGTATSNLGITLLYFFVTLVLYWYAVKGKKTFLLGNLLVAFLCALVAFLVLYAELETVRLLNTQHFQAAIFILELFKAYIVFAFLTTLIREIIKDMEDIEGDLFGKARTVPIVAGVPVAKFSAGISIILLALSLLFWWPNTFEDFSIQGIWFYVGLLFPLGLVFIGLILAKTKQAFHHLSQVMKVIMLSGLLYLLLI